MEQNTWPGGGRKSRIIGQQPACGLCVSLRNSNFEGSLTPRLQARAGDPGRGENTGRGFESSGLQASNRRWLVPFIKRKNFRFSESFVFNDIADF